MGKKGTTGNWKLQLARRIDHMQFLIFIRYIHTKLYMIVINSNDIIV